MSKLYSASKLLGLTDALAIIAVIGCGGKTTFIEKLAHELPNKKVLITPTTKIKPMVGNGVVLCKTLQECTVHKPVNGIQCLGILNNNSLKLEALPPELLAEMVGQYDIVLLEADGSRGLPCKGWLASEPVIPDYCTHTVGIVTLNALAKPADENSVLRLSEFLALTKIKQGELITLDTLRRMLCASNGMFKNSVGENFIFINQVESSKNAVLAQRLITNIKKQHPYNFAAFAYGSAQKNKWAVPASGVLE